VEFKRNDAGVMYRQVNDIILEHVAATRPGRAANERTKFVAAVIKAIEGLEAPADDETKPGDKHAARSAVAHKEHPLAPENTPWSFTEKDRDELLAPDGGNWPRYKSAHSWFDADADPADPEIPEAKAAYALAHHKMVGGKLLTNWQAVVSATAALLGVGTSKAKIPARDRGAVARHLASHYREFDRTPPPALDALAKGRKATLDRAGFLKFMAEVNGETQVEKWLTDYGLEVAKAVEPEAKPETPAEPEVKAEVVPVAKVEPPADEGTGAAAQAPAAEDKTPPDATEKAAPDAPPAEDKSATDADVDKAKCPKCKETQPSGAKYCSGCGAKMTMKAEEPEVVKAAKPAPLSERVAKTLGEAATLYSASVDKVRMVSAWVLDALAKGLADPETGAHTRAALEGLLMPEAKAEGGVPLTEVQKAMVMRGVVRVLADAELGPVFKAELLALVAPEAAAKDQPAPAAAPAADVALKSEVEELLKAAAASLGEMVEKAVSALGVRVRAIEDSTALCDGAVADIDVTVVALAKTVAETKATFDERLVLVEQVAGPRKGLMPDGDAGGGQGRTETVNKDKDSTEEKQPLWKGVLGRGLDQFRRRKSSAVQP